MPELPFGEITPVQQAEVVRGNVVAADESDGYQTLLIELPAESIKSDRWLSRTWVVRVDGAGLGGAPAVLAGSEVTGIVPATTAEQAIRVWVRRPKTTGVPGVAASEAVSLTADVYLSVAVALDGQRMQMFDSGPSNPGEVVPGLHFKMTAELPREVPAKPKVLAAYLTALGESRPDSPVSWFLGAKEPSPLRSAGRPAEVTDDWSDLMRFTTGYESVEAALVTEDHLRAPVSPAAAKVPFASLKGPELRRHEWAAMLKGLPGVAPSEPLAAMVPAEFYYARAKTFAAFQALMDRVDEIVTPGLRVLEQHRQQLDISERYRWELGLPKDDLARILGPQLVRSLVLTGSDPMVRQGSDLSLILEVPHLDAVLNVLALKRASVSQTLPLTETNWSHAGIAVSSHLSADGRVRQEVASFKRADGKTFVLISNSKNAARRILDTWLGQHAPLANELDFQYMLKRDPAVEEDVLLYMGDRFVAEAVSPRQRIIDSRRQVAKAELAAMGYGSLLFAQLYGRLPKDARELGGKLWFGPKRLRHASGDQIRYDQELGPSSPWGTPARLSSIIDLPTPARISKAEQAAYQQFSQRYESQWGERIDPIALRVKASDEVLDAHLRVLPLVNSSDYQDVLQWSGGGTTTRSASLDGLAGILAIGQGSPLREFLSGNGRSFLGDRFKLDWLGDWVEVGLADERSLAELVRQHGRLPMPVPEPRPLEEDAAVIGKLPAYLALDVKSAAGAAMMLTVLRELATGASPDTFQWGEHSKYRETTLVRVSAEDLTVFYALTKRRLLVALRVEVLHRLIDGLAADTETPQTASVAGTTGDQGSQLVVDLKPKSDPRAPMIQQSALRTIASWFLEKGARESGIGNPLAELLLGASADNLSSESYKARAFRWLGAMPVTVDGKPYQNLPSGVTDPDRGSPHAPKWPKVPVTPGPAAQLLSSVLGLRTEVSVDEEPGTESERSLRARVRLRVNGANPPLSSLPPRQ